MCLSTPRSSHAASIAERHRNRWGLEWLHTTATPHPIDAHAEEDADEDAEEDAAQPQDANSDKHVDRQVVRRRAERGTPGSRTPMDSVIISEI